MIWAILGLSAGILGLACLAVAGLFVETDLYQQYRFQIGVAIAVAGAAAWLRGLQLAGKKAGGQAEGGGHPAEKESEERFFLADCRYWGIILCLFGTLVPFVSPLRMHRPAAQTRQAALPPRRTNAVTVVAEVTPTPPPPPAPAPTFPEFRLQGIIYRENEPAAIINGRTFMVGDRIGDAEISAIQRHGVTLRMGPETKTVNLPGEARASAVK